MPSATRAFSARPGTSACRATTRGWSSATSTLSRCKTNHRGTEDTEGGIRENEKVEEEAPLANGRRPPAGGVPHQPAAAGRSPSPPLSFPLIFSRCFSLCVLCASGVRSTLHLDLAADNHRPGPAAHLPARVGAVAA